MPNLSTLISGSVSVGILAGVVSGLFYLVVAGIRWAGRLRAELQEEEERQAAQRLARHPRCANAQCRNVLLPFLSGKRVTCAECEDQVCRPCAERRGELWVCVGCAKKREVKLQSGEWFYRQVQGRFSKAAITANSNGGGEDGSVMDSDTAQVREFIEKLVEGLVNGRLDNVYVNRLYNHPDYDRMFSRYHSCLCETLARLGFALHMAITNKPLTEVESPSSVHAELKTLVNRIIRDAVTLPNFKQVIERKMSNGERLSEDIDIKTYEDILATAILNKVIEKFQRYQVTNSSALDGNSNLLDGFPGHIGQKPKYISRLEIGVSESGSVEDCDGISRGDGSWSESSHTEPMSLMVEECIEEVTTYNSSEEEEAVGPEDHSGGSELDFYLSGLNFIQRHRVPFPELGMDIIDGAGYESNESGEDDEAEGKVSPKPTDLYTPIESWEENWLFQKRRLKSNSGANQSVPVPMLVPNPSEDYRALIGDRDAEEISDLSECSEGELDATLSELASPEDGTTFTFPERGVMIGGDTSDKPAKGDRNVKSDKSQQALSQSDTPDGGCGGYSEEYSSLQDGAPELAEATNNELFKTSSVDCLSEFGQQDSEYTEDYAAVTQRQMSSLTLIDESEAKPMSKPRSLGVPPQLKVNGESSTENQKVYHLESNDSQIEIELATPPKPGTIAEREHKKWESALPLQNNPYSSENITKRLQKKTRYGSRSSSEASIELPDFHNEPPVVKHPTSPLKVVCTGSELDTRRYGRDYYVNSKLPKDETKQNTKLAALEELLLSSGSPQQPKSSNTGARQEGTVTPSSRSTTTEGNGKQSDSEELQQFSRHVESEVARWQHEINQTEQHWIKKLQSNKSENDNSAVITSTRVSDVTHEATCMIITKPGTNKPQTRIELPHVADISRKFESIVSDENKLLATNKDTVKHQSSIKETKAVNIISKTFEKPPKVPIKETVRKSKLSKNCEKRQKSTKGEITSVSVLSKNFEKSLQVLKEDNLRRNNTRQDIITKSRSCESVLTLPMLGKGMETKVPVTPYPTPPCVVTETLKANGDSPAMNGNSRKWEVESSRSEGSTVSSDSEFSPHLPSVKELSKHFSGGTDSDSSTSASKGPSPSLRLKGTDLCTAMKEVVIITKEDQLKDHQQQHYHLATPPTRPVRQVHSLTARSMTREFREGLRRNFPVAMDRNVYNTTGSDSSLTGAKSPVNGRDGYDTTPGYTSDESGTVSPVPTPGQMRNNIAFWEQMNNSK